MTAFTQLISSVKTAETAQACKAQETLAATSEFKIAAETAIATANAHLSSLSKELKTLENSLKAKKITHHTEQAVVQGSIAANKQTIQNLEKELAEVKATTDATRVKTSQIGPIIRRESGQSCSDCSYRAYHAYTSNNN